MTIPKLLLAAALVSLSGASSVAQNETRHTNDAETVKGFDPLDSLSPASLPAEHRSVHPLPEELKPWEGVWRGQWEGTLDALLTIVSADGKKVTAYYAWGTNLLVTNPGGNLYRGTIEKDTAIFPISKGLTITFKMNGDRLDALHHSPAKETASRAVFSKL